MYQTLMSLPRVAIRDVKLGWYTIARERIVCDSELPFNGPTCATKDLSPMVLSNLMFRADLV